MKIPRVGVFLAGRVFAFIAAAFAPDLACAQPQLIDEIVVAWDEAGHIDRIDAEMLQRLERVDAGIAEQIGSQTAGERFVDATLLRGPESSYVLDTLVRRGNDLVHRRRSLRAEEAEALRQRVRAALAAGQARGTFESDNRTWLVVGSSILGLAFYDWALPVSQDWNSKEGVAGGMLAAAASFFGPYLATRGTHVSAGEANLALYGGTRGIPHGMLAYHAFRKHREVIVDPAFPPLPDEGDTDHQLASSIAGSVLEGIGGYFWASAADLSGSTAHLIGMAGDVGLLWGAGLYELLDGPNAWLDFRAERGMCISGLGGAAVGLAGGKLFAARRDHSWGDVEVLRMSGLVGAMTGLAIGDVATEDEDNALLAGALAGSAAGLVLGDRLVRDVDLSLGQGILVDAGALAGAALGLGVAYLATSDGSDNSNAYTAVAALGAAGGGGATFFAVRNAARRSGDRRGDLHFEITPLAVRAHWRF